MGADEDEPHVPDMGQPVSGLSHGPSLPAGESCRSSVSHKQQSKGVEVDMLPSMSGAAGAEAASLAPGSPCKEEPQPVLIPNDILEVRHCREASLLLAPCLDFHSSHLQEYPKQSDFTSLFLPEYCFDTNPWCRSSNP